MNREQLFDVIELAGATGVWLFQWCVLILGLLPILALTAVLALPLVALALIPVRRRRLADRMMSRTSY
jgi:hypothetical protein